MSHLEERISVACPPAQAAMRLGRFFAENGGSNAETATLTLGIKVNVPGLSTPVTVERSVIATIQPHSLAGDMTPRYRVKWAPQKPGPFPLFNGELLVEGGADYDTFALRLSGDYTPPFGIVGKGFDVLVGNHVAQATAADLLNRIKERIEQEFAADEARKTHVELPLEAL